MSRHFKGVALPPTGQREAGPVIDGVRLAPLVVHLWDSAAQLFVQATVVERRERLAEHAEADREWCASGRPEPVPEHPAAAACSNARWSLDVGDAGRFRETGTAIHSSGDECDAVITFAYDGDDDPTTVTVRTTDAVDGRRLATVTMTLSS